MTNITKTRFVIIGAGPTGLGAAYRLRDLGESDFVILDRNAWIGGLASSFVDEKGFTWDIGGHVQFSHYKYFDDAMDRALGVDGWFHRQRESWVWMKDRFVPYPFQNNVRYLPREDVWKCLRGALEVASQNGAPKPRDFKEWILHVFGSGIAELFMLPYNFKVWAYPPEEMGYEWIGERVSVVDVKRVIENVVLEKDDLSWGPNNLFRFPKTGGTGEIWRSIGSIVGTDKIRLKTEVRKVNPKEKTVELADGEKIQYEKLLSCMPLDALVPMVDGVSEAARSAVKTMKHSSSNIVGIGLNGQPKPELTTKCWLYYPENDCPFYRVTVFSNYSPNHVPDSSRQFSLMTETSESPAKPVDRKTLAENVITGLLNTKMIESRDQVCSVWQYCAEYGYPTPFLGRDVLLRKVLAELDQLGVNSRGRFGAWRYEVSNQDHSFMQGVEWINSVLAGEPERTIWGTH